MSEDGAQKGDPEAPPLFDETKQGLLEKLELKISVWYLDIENLTENAPRP